MNKYLVMDQPEGKVAQSQLEAIQTMLVNDHYLFLDKDLKIIDYSHNCNILAEEILRDKMLPGRSLFEIFGDADNDLSTIKLKDFFNSRVLEDIISFKFKIDDQILSVSLKEIPMGYENGYACVMVNQKPFVDRSTILDNLHLVANLSWFTSHKLRGPLSAMMSMIDHHSEQHLTKSKHIQQLFTQMRQQAAHLDQALHTLNNLLSDHRPLQPIVTKIEQAEIKNILMLDDEVITHMVTKRIVADLNPDINVFSFTDGREALEYLRTFPTDLILLDLNMPQINGWEFLELMAEEGVNIPTIIISSSIDNADINRSFEYDVVKGFINKPVSKDDLKRILAKSIQLNKM